MTVSKHKAKECLGRKHRSACVHMLVGATIPSVPILCCTLVSTLIQDVGENFFNVYLFLRERESV